MKAKQLLGLIGSIVLFIGVFTPIVSIPLIGEMNYFQNGKGDGTIVLILAVISFILVLAQQYRGLSGKNAYAEAEVALVTGP